VRASQYPSVSLSPLLAFPSSCSSSSCCSSSQLETLGTPYARAGHGMAAWGGGLLVFGGATNSLAPDSTAAAGTSGGAATGANAAAPLLNDVALLDRGTLEWSSLAPYLPAAAAAAPAAGGSGGATAPQPRARAAVAVSGDVLVVAGGNAAPSADTPRM
jgi:hypothetical protein